MKNLVLASLDVESLSTREMREIGGGISFSSLTKRAGLWWVVQEVITHWDDVKAGFKKGYSETI